MIQSGDYVIYTSGDRQQRTAKALSGRIRNEEASGYHYLLEIRQGRQKVQIQIPAAYVRPLPPVETEAFETKAGAA